MAARSTDQLSKMYDYDSESKAYIIKISIKQYKDIFNDLDPAPIKRRDLDQDLVWYLDDSSMDIPLKHSINLQIIGPIEIRDEEKEIRVKDGLKTYFNFVKNSLERQIYMYYKKALRYVLVFLILISFSFYLRSKVTSSISADTLFEGLSIGGWVFLWEAIELIVFKNREISGKYKRYRRLEEAAIEYIYI